MLNYIDIEDYVTSIQYLNYPDAALVTLLASVDILASIPYSFSVFHHIHPSSTLDGLLFIRPSPNVILLYLFKLKLN